MRCLRARLGAVPKRWAWWGRNGLCAVRMVWFGAVGSARCGAVGMGSALLGAVGMGSALLCSAGVVLLGSVGSAGWLDSVRLGSARLGPCAGRSPPIPTQPSGSAAPANFGCAEAPPPPPSDWSQAVIGTKNHQCAWRGGGAGPRWVPVPARPGVVPVEPSTAQCAPSHGLCGHP